MLTDARLRRILSLAGHTPRLGWPSERDGLLIWGAAGTSERGARIVSKTGAQPIYLEDAFLRSIHPGRAGDPPLGLLIDDRGLHFDPSRPSRLENLLGHHPLDDTALLERARGAIARLGALHLSKYNAFDPSAPAPAPGYVLVIDQVAGDASVHASKGYRARFQEMLCDAQEENPGQPILIRTHPETTQGHRTGMYGAEDCNDRTQIFDAPISPWHLLEGATAVYTLSSQMGFEAILAGHRPHVYGQPFYAGWGLTEDRDPIYRRQRRLTPAQLFAAAMILYPTWYDPYGDRLCELEQVIDTLEAETRAWRDDRKGWVASGMRLWKRGTLAKFYGHGAGVRFATDPENAVELSAETGHEWMAWAGKTEPDWEVTRVEDGFIRSRGLGAELVPPLSLVTDKRGIYYDPTRKSDLEVILNNSTGLRRDQITRAEQLIRTLIDQNISKYNLEGDLPELPKRPLILVPGQVEDDASIRLGAGKEKSNLALLQRARAENPDATILYKPHPDVEAGLRTGVIPEGQMNELADLVVRNVDPAALLGHVDEVWTMTSTLGFEALLRGVPVTTLGAPFYAGWGLTRDLGPVPTRRRARLTLPELVHGALICYPRYFDPLTGRPCPVEVAVARLASGQGPKAGLSLRLLSKAQGLLAGYAHLWR
ncbi:capsular polysaccharide biosynthesis protein [Donghicola sp. XS_ASV15]|uniref:capsular polysaccharide biosynthesis protein n=1 Tax=Donghicola sp. XS_ASV15 TaxID=3241295 RepID=UPI00351723B7